MYCSPATMTATSSVAQASPPTDAMSSSVSCESSSSAVGIGTSVDGTLIRSLAGVAVVGLVVGGADVAGAVVATTVVATVPSAVGTVSVAEALASSSSPPHPASAIS